MIQQRTFVHSSLRTRTRKVSLGNPNVFKPLFFVGLRPDLHATQETVNSWLTFFDTFNLAKARSLGARVPYRDDDSVPYALTSAKYAEAVETSLETYPHTQNVSGDVIELRGINALLAELAVHPRGTYAYADEPVTLSQVADQLNGLLSATGRPPTHVGYDWNPFVCEGSIIVAKQLVDSDPAKYVFDNNPNSSNGASGLKVVAYRIRALNVPHSVFNVSQANNAVLLLLRYVADAETNNGRPFPVELTSSSAIQGLIIQLRPGVYSTVSEVVTELQRALNEAVETRTVTAFEGLFTCTYVSTTGKVTITCTDETLEFHLRFLSHRDDDDAARCVSTRVPLWRMLGFPSPYQLENTLDLWDTNKYVQVLTNAPLTYDVHPTLHVPRVRSLLRDPRTDSVNVATSSPPESNPDMITQLPYIQPVRLLLFIDELSKVQPVASVTLNPASSSNNNSVVDNDDFTNITSKQQQHGLRTLTIRWTNELGEPVDFHGVEHSFILETLHRQ